jgi:hypothetical protein
MLPHAREALASVLGEIAPLEVRLMRWRRGGGGRAVHAPKVSAFRARRPLTKRAQIAPLSCRPPNRSRIGTVCVPARAPSPYIELFALVELQNRDRLHSELTAPREKHSDVDLFAGAIVRDLVAGAGRETRASRIAAVIECR